MKTIFRFLAAAGMFGPAAFGCAGPATSAITGASVHGTVLHKGKPLTGGTIRLVSVTDANKSTGGQILGDGSYEVLNAPLGEVLVLIETESAKFDRSALVRDAKPQGVDLSKLPPPLKYVAIDKTYGDPTKTPLRLTIRVGRHSQDIELK